MAFLKTIALVLCAISLLATARADDAGTDWREASRSHGLVIYNRSKANSNVHEIKAVGTIDAPPWVVKNVIDDADHYASFMPYVAECRVISRDSASIVSYQRLSLPVVSDRDYVLQIRDESRRGDNGEIVYINRWKSTEAGIAEKPGIIRVKINEGSWVLEPADSGKRTQATYFIYTDPGGKLPAWIINKSNSNVIPKVFDAVRKAAADPKYWKTKPARP